MKPVAMEKDRTDTLLGLQFWDRLTNSIVAKGLQVTAQKLSNDQKKSVGKAVVGRATPNGVIAFSGLVSEEKPSSSDKRLPWSKLPTTQEFVWVEIHMIDRQQRFLPMAFVTKLPVKDVYKGEDMLALGAVTVAARGVQLWSAPTRSVPPGSAVVRAEVVVGTGDEPKPAAYALVKVRSQNSVAFQVSEHYGLTDDRGILALMMPYPILEESSQLPSLKEQTFPISVEVFCQESQSASRIADSVPDLSGLLNQPQARIITTYDQNVVDFVDSWPRVLVFERPLVLQSVLRSGLQSTAPLEPESVLRIGPAP